MSAVDQVKGLEKRIDELELGNKRSMKQLNI